MNNQNFMYDVAFSFLQEDEGLAIQLCDMLEGRYNTFIYSEKQVELAGKDGEETFNLVFGEQSRVVVVLFRNNWGKTGWTRIEMTAIRNRGYEYGYDFSLFIPLEKNSRLPKWLPKTQIWFDSNRWGIEGTIPVIEYKIKQEGGSTKKETAVDKAERINRLIESKEKKKAFLDSVKE